MAEHETRSPYPFLVRAYVDHVKPHTRGKRATWGAEWVEGTHEFGRVLMWAGAVVIVASWFHPDLAWRLTIGPMGLIVSGAGAWHRVYASAICELALMRGKG